MLQGSQQLPILWSHIPFVAVVSHASNTLHNHGASGSYCRPLSYPPVHGFSLSTTPTHLQKLNAFHDGTRVNLPWYQLSLRLGSSSIKALKPDPNWGSSYSPYLLVIQGMLSLCKCGLNREVQFGSDVGVRPESLESRSWMRAPSVAEPCRNATHHMPRPGLWDRIQGTSPHRSRYL